MNTFESKLCTENVRVPLAKRRKLDVQRRSFTFNLRPVSTA